MALEQLEQLPAYTDNFSPSRPSDLSLRKARFFAELGEAEFATAAAATDGTIEMVWFNPLTKVKYKLFIYGPEDEPSSSIEFGITSGMQNEYF